jgi:Ni,Fe-hydrogenase III component G
MNDLERIERIKAVLGERAAEVTNPAPRRIFVTVAAPDLVPAVLRLQTELGYWYLATISGLDAGDAFEFLYHFGDEGGNLNVRTRVPKSDPRLPSICAVIPGAILYERELQDMFGVRVEKIPDGRPLVLPDDWPAGNFPLRKDWKHVRTPEKIPGGKP